MSEPTLVSRARSSLAYRSGRLARAWLSVLPTARLRPRPTQPVTYVTLAGRAHRDLLRESIRSLAATWDCWPEQVVVVSDGSLAPSAATRLLSFYPGTVSISSWRDVAPAEYEVLEAFAEREPMARKIAAVAGLAREATVIYADVDVLWFRRPAIPEPFRSRVGPALLLSTDLRPAYDPRLVPGELAELAQPPYRCAGLLLARGDFLAAAGVDDLLEFGAGSGVPLTEQTLLAEASRRLGFTSWSMDEVFMSDRDAVSFRPSFIGRPWAARHYIGQVRHLFWRDALALRWRTHGSSAAACAS